MHAYQIIPLMLLAVGCLVGHLGWAQRRTAVAPLAPVRPAALNALPEGVLRAMQPSRLPPPPSAIAPATPRIWPQPIYLLNAHFIIGKLSSLNPQDINKIDIYKGADAPAQWQGITAYGIINVTLKPGVKLKLKTKSLAAIRRQAKASGVVSFQLNGMRLEDSSLRVATAAIAGLEVLRSDSGTTINIRISSPQLPPPAPPGTIHIRGVASQ